MFQSMVFFCGRKKLYNSQQRPYRLDTNMKKANFIGKNREGMYWKLILNENYCRVVRIMKTENVETENISNCRGYCKR